MGIFEHWPHEIHTLSESACNHRISGLWLLNLCIEAFALKTNPVQHPRVILDFSVSEDSQRSQFSSVNDKWVFSYNYILENTEESTHIKLQVWPSLVSDQLLVSWKLLKYVYSDMHLVCIIIGLKCILENDIFLMVRNIPFFHFYNFLKNYSDVFLNIHGGNK